MRKILSIIVISLMSIGLTYSSEKSVNESIEKANVISGKVVDKITGEGLAGVEVSLMGSEKKVYTDFDGNFMISNIESGAQAIRIKYISYEELVENVYSDSENNNEVVVIKLNNVKK